VVESWIVKEEEKKEKRSPVSLSLLIKLTL